MKRVAVILFLSFFLNASLIAQNPIDTNSGGLTLEACISQALRNQPSIKQFAIDETIADQEIKERLADWFPQLGLTYNYQHNLQLPTAFFPDANGVKRPVTTGVKNSSNIQFSLSQNIFNRDLLLANRSAGSYRQQARQLSSSNKIDIVVAVSKAYYDLLLTQKQVAVLDENIVRLEKSVQDAFNKYEGGIVDKIDYKRAQIALNSTRADRKRAFDAIVAKRVYLQELMGVGGDTTILVNYDSLKMEREAFYDTTQTGDFSQRIEWQLLQTRQRLLEDNLRYNKWSFLPSVGGFGSYNPTFQNDKFVNLYNTAYPTSFLGFQMTLPIFQGGKRIRSIRIAELQLSRLEEDKKALSNNFTTQYAEALSGYKGGLANLISLRDNLALAEDVYNTLRIQYNAGIKTYLEVIISETEFRSAQINYLNALYQVLSNKLDLQRATGSISFN
ncbi:MAG: TolC family protein [Gemmatimonadaceae bacterium]|nr:TolC family protein [Chitinophagaceae bacterium]